VQESQSLLIAAMTHFRRSVSTTRRIDSCVCGVVPIRSSHCGIHCEAFCVTSRHPNPLLRSTTALTETFNHKQTNSVALVREQTIPTERPQLVGEVGANIYTKNIAQNYNEIYGDVTDTQTYSHNKPIQENNFAENLRFCSGSNLLPRFSCTKSCQNQILSNPVPVWIRIVRLYEKLSLRYAMKTYGGVNV
jgi:hypothetical protein